MEADSGRRKTGKEWKRTEGCGRGKLKEEDEDDKREEDYRKG